MNNVISNKLNFTANFLKDVSILKKDYDGEYSPCTVSLVELDTEDNNDIKALYKTASLWAKKGCYYAFGIYNDATKECKTSDVEKEHYIALTTQEDNYSHLDHNKVLGLAMFSEMKFEDNRLDFLEVNPKTSKSKSRNRQYKEAGKAIIQYLKDNYNQNIGVSSDSRAVDFYRKQGFVSVDNKNPEIMCYNA